MALLGDARSGKLADNIAGFGRALRRAGLRVDSARIALAQEAAQLVDLGRRDDLGAAMEAVLVSREQDPLDPAVVTVGSFVGGAKHNIIPDEAKLLLTVRSYSDETRERLIQGIKRIARGEAIAAGVPDDRMPIVSVKD